MLLKRGWQLLNRCFLCGLEEETVHHILLHFSMVRHLWEIIFALFFFKWVFPKTDLSWEIIFALSRGKIWEKLGNQFLCVFFGQFRKKNRMTFKDQSLALKKLKHSFVHNIWSWNKVYLKGEANSLIVFLEWLISAQGLVRFFSYFLFSLNACIKIVYLIAPLLLLIN